MLKEENIIKNSEKNLIQTINYSTKKIKKTKKTFVVILVIIILSLITLFAIDLYRMQNNKPVLFSTWGFPYTSPIDLSQDEIEIAIKDYVVDKSDKENLEFANAKAFASIKVFLTEENDNSIYNVYAWVLQEKYYLENTEVKRLSASSLPYQFIVKKDNNNKYVVIDSRIPRDGSYYEDDMKNIFPSSIRSKIDKVNSNGIINQLELDIQQQVKLYFHK